MAIKIGNTDISAFKVGSGDCKIYIGDTLLYPTTPSFDGKWLATCSDSHTESAACDSTSAITQDEMARLDFVDIQLGDCVTYIVDFAFYSHRGLSGITIPDSVTSVGDNAFYRCSSLTSISIPSGVTIIGDSAFAFCSGLTSCTIGSGVTSIGIRAFYKCSGMTSVTVNATTPPTLGDYAFDDTNNCPIYVPSENLNDYKNASGWYNYTSRLTPIP